jgi:hypothetical protein
MIRTDRRRSLSTAANPRRPSGPGTVQDELEWMPPTCVPMSEADEEKVVQLLAAMIRPAVERWLNQRAQVRRAA